MRLLERAGDHTSELVCVNCLEVCDPELPAVIFAKGFVSGARAGLCNDCHDQVLALADEEVVSDAPPEAGESG